MSFVELTSDATVTLWSSGALANNEIIDVAAIVHMTTKTLGGGSAYWSRRFLGVQNINGTLADPLGGTLDSDAIPPEIASGLTGATAQIVISGTSVNIVVARPPGVDCYVTIDGGVPDYARGAAPFNPPTAPTLTSIAPNIGASTGGSTITLTGTNFVAGATVAINGVPCTSVVVVNPTTITCVTPNFGNANGSTVGQTVTVTTSGGSGSGTTTASKYFYLPTNTPIAALWRTDAGVTTSGGKTTLLADQSGNGNSLAQATSADQPPAPAGNFSGSGLPFLTFDGIATFMTGALGATIAGGVASMFSVFQYNAVTSASNSPFEVRGTGSVGLRFYAATNANQYASDIAANVIRVGTPDTNPHVLGMVSAAGAGNSSGWFDSTKTTGTLTQGLNVGAAIDIGRSNDISGASYSQCNWLLGLIYNGALSNADQTTVISILRTTSNV